MKLFFSSCLFLSMIILSACDKTENVTPPCGDAIVIDADLYSTAPADDFQFQSVVIDGDCLTATVRYGGGCGGADFQLIDASGILKSLPIQRNLRLSLDDNDHCEALLTKELSYDLAPLQVAGYSEIILNVDGFQGDLVYQY